SSLPRTPGRVRLRCLLQHQRESLVRTWRAPYSARQRPSSSPLATLPGAEGAPLRPLKNQLRPLPRSTMPDWQLDVKLAPGERRRPHFRDRPLTPAGDLRSVPDAGNPEVEEIALWGTTTPTSPLPVEGRELLCTQMLPSAYRSTVPTFSRKESISSPLGDALPPRIRTRSLISPAREPGKKLSAAQTFHLLGS
ncbi:hypothetical protein M9458_030600, partial [Cirrhinus mrigala]